MVRGISNNEGYCHSFLLDILYNELSVEEHLQLIGEVRIEVIKEKICENTSYVTSI